MKEIHKLNKYTEKKLNSFISNEIQESINIELKDGRALDKTPEKKKELSKDVAAMANSNGGIIIYGIAEKEHKASYFSFIDGNIYNKEWLEQTIKSSIKRFIPELKIFPVRIDNEISKTIYVVQIPESYDAPHQSIDKKFYRRHNFQSIPMEEYEIRGLYGRKLKSKLELSGYNISVIEIEDDKTIFLCEAGVYNDGEIAENDYKVNVYFDNTQFITMNWSTNGVGRNYDYTKLGDGNIIKITNHKLPIIYPEETINALRFNFEIPNDKIKEAFKDLKIRFKLMYSNGNEDFETDLVELGEKLLLKIKE